MSKPQRFHVFTCRSIHRLSGRAKLTIAAMLTLCMTSACGDGVSSPTPVVRRSLTGVVTEAMPTTATAVAGARISIDDGPNAGMSAVTDAAGRYSLSGLTDSTFNLRASAPGYEDRTGAIVLSEDRVLNLQLLPVLRTVTDTVSGALDVGTCNGEVWIICFAHPIDVHHNGFVDTTLTVDGGGPAVQLQLHDVTNQKTWDWSNRTLDERTIRLVFATHGPGRYEYRIYGRVSKRIPFTLVMTHPN